jgi:hypothetical protein
MRREPCKQRRPPARRAYARPEASPSARLWLEGVVYIGHLVAGGDGNEVEVIEAVPCRCCADSPFKGGANSEKASSHLHTPEKNPPALSRILAYVAYTLA